MKRLVINLQMAFALLLLTFAVGCAQLQASSSFEAKTLAAASTVDQVQQTATKLLVAKKISSADAENVLKGADAAVAGIQIARAYAKTDPAAAGSKLEVVIASLTLLQTYLATQGAK